MKKILLPAFLLISFTAAFATTIRVRVSNNQFTPKAVNARLGDTILWVWKEGTHTTTSTSVPAGALTWDKPMTTTSKKFKYKLTKAGKYSYWCKIHGLTMTASITVTTALAADLTDFAVTEDDAKAVLNWKTMSGKDVSYFSVQRSTDGENFTEIARVQPSQTLAYKFADNTDLPDKYRYYQVEAVDTKGNKQLSSIEMFTSDVKTAKLITSLSPNPVSRAGHLMMQFNADKEGSMLVQLYSGGGLFIKQAEMTAVKGLNNGHFHLGDLTPGTYYIVCTLGAVKEKHTIIVR